MSGLYFWIGFSLIMFSVGYIIGRKDERKNNPPRVVYAVAEIVE